VGQSYMGGSVGVATETIGILANIGRCMLLSPLALACGVSAGGYRVLLPQNGGSKTRPTDYA